MLDHLIVHVLIGAVYLEAAAHHAYKGHYHDCWRDLALFTFYLSIVVFVHQPMTLEHAAASTLCC